LYGAIARLETRGLIERLEADDRRNPYRLTALGEKALRARLASIQAVARIGQRRLASP
jgi:DNA-binding PadR family transcriptional regulator